MVLELEGVEQVVLRYEVPGDLFVSEIGWLHQNDKFTDVLIRGSDRTTIKAHSALLASSSKFLRSLLNDVVHSNDEITLVFPDFTVGELSGLLQFLYTGKTVLNVEQFLQFQHLLVHLDIDSSDTREIILEDATPSATRGPSSPDKCSSTEQTTLHKTLNTFMLDGQTEERENLTPHPAVDETGDEKFNSGGERPAPQTGIMNSETEDVPRQPFRCHVCDAEFSTENKLNDHVMKHDDTRPYKCDTCEKTYPLKASLTAHMKMHTQDKPHQCERCGKAFVIRSLLEQHLRTHTNERPYTCEVCGKAFRNKSNLLGHRKTHSGNKPHVCSVCQRRFNRRHDLDAHVRIHTGDRPFLCSACPKAFRFSSALRVHLKRVHNS